jgi:hypothetical protein
VKTGVTLQTPSFLLETGKLWYLVKGAGRVYAAISQHVVLVGPLHGQIVLNFDTKGQWQWISQDLTAYPGLRTHLEFWPTNNQEFAVARIAEAPVAPPQPSALNSRIARLVRETKDDADLVKHLNDALRDALHHLEMGTLADAPPGTAELADWVARNPRLWSAEGTLPRTARDLLDAQAKLIAQLQRESRLAPAISELTGVNGRVFIRGNPKSLGEAVPRRHLEAFAGKPFASPSSGRQELAEHFVDTAANPFVPRVMVNRVWHHLLGKGLVPSVDNLGVLGDAPSHPELLDALALHFVKNGWSIKKLIREILLSKTYQMASTPRPEASKLDPDNTWLHRARLRRLEGEALRDAMLSVSGRLDCKAGGPGVLVYLTPFQDGRGRPASGPLDGDGRRSVYLAVRRNFISPFLLAFDYPTPFTTMGRRTVSNVPAQGLILMNDPFVKQQAELWAKRVLKEVPESNARIRAMYRAALARDPSDAELRTCQDSISDDNLAAWTALAQALFSTKEFAFVH